MRIIDAQTAEEYLRRAGSLAPGEAVRVSELAGGVSNMVLLVERIDRGGDDFVLKQARGQLRTAQPWFSSVERVWREADVLRLCTRLLAAGGQPSGDLPAARTPKILFEDRDNYLFAMTAAPRPNTVWKQELLAGRTDARIAAACGRLLGALHAQSWLDEDVARQIGDRTLFDQLRIDPYYRTLAGAHDELRPTLERLMASLDDHPRSLVHADFSPKNLLVSGDGLMMVDFETGHYGDPAFDLGFFLSHLVLKACAKIPRHAEYLALSEAFRKAYDEAVVPKIGSAELGALWARGVQNFAACAWARLDGKSPIDYLDDPQRRELVRGMCREVFAARPDDWSQVVALCAERFAQAAKQNGPQTCKGPAR